MTRDELITLMQTERQRVSDAIVDLPEEAMTQPPKADEWR